MISGEKQKIAVPTIRKTEHAVPDCRKEKMSVPEKKNKHKMAVQDNIGDTDSFKLQHWHF